VLFIDSKSINIKLITKSCWFCNLARGCAVTIG